MPTLYNSMISANCYKVRLLLHQAEVPYRRVEIDIRNGESRRAPFLAKNPNGRVPALELDDGTVLSESAAILFYLADRTPFLSEDAVTRAQTLQWLFFEQYSHEPYIAVMQFLVTYPDAPDQRRAIIEFLTERGRQALAVMETHLATRQFFVGDGYSIADIALYAYTHTARKGGFDLDAYPRVGAWLERVRAQPRHVGLEQG
ncbi:MAG TPA: glutathione S-transferase family protein [Stellaceae bacterium]|nr:glutathione S-transferase family protein [Stellaceae bacterium]